MHVSGHFLSVLNKHEACDYIFYIFCNRVPFRAFCISVISPFKTITCDNYLRAFGEKQRGYRIWQ